jgi:hypothetical protein
MGELFVATPTGELISRVKGIVGREAWKMLPASPGRHQTEPRGSSNARIHEQG